MILAEIIAGKKGAADLFFLIAVILFALDAVVRLAKKSDWWTTPLMSLGLGFTALGLFVL